MHKWLELTLGGKSPPRILRNDHVACLNYARTIKIEFQKNAFFFGERGILERKTPIFVVRQARHQDGPLPLLRRTIDIGGEFDAIAHRNHYIFFNHHTHG